MFNVPPAVLATVAVLVLVHALRMLVLTGGRERTIDDYSSLAAGAGLQVTAVHDITERHVIIECVAT